MTIINMIGILCTTISQRDWDYLLERRKMKTITLKSTEMLRQLGMLFLQFSGYATNIHTEGPFQINLENKTIQWHDKYGNVRSAYLSQWNQLIVPTAQDVDKPIDIEKENKDLKELLLEWLQLYGYNYALSNVEETCLVLDHPRNGNSNACYCLEVTY